MPDPSEIRKMHRLRRIAVLTVGGSMLLTPLLLAALVVVDHT